MSGATIGGIVGGVIGAFFGAPQIGFAIGSLVGGAIDPDVIKGPSLGDMPIQTSQEGVPRPIVFGSPPPFPGNIIQIGPKIFLTKRERQGKGGPVVESQEVYQSYIIRISQGPATVITVWRDGKVVFDRSGKFPIDADGMAFSARVRFYEGDEEQLPDAGFEGLVGSGRQPAYRGTAYMAVYSDNLTNTGGRIPNYEFRMASHATVTDECGAEPGLLFWYPLNDATPGGRAAELIHGYDGIYSSDNVSGGQALSIDGFGSAEFRQGGYMHVDTSVLPGFGAYDDWTVSLWFQPLPGESEVNDGINDGGTSDKEIAVLDGGAFGALGPSHHWKFHMLNPNTPAIDKNRYPRMTITHSGGTSTSNLEDPSLVVNFRTYYAVMTYKRDTPGSGNGTLTGYINGVQVQQNLNIPHPTGTNGFELLVGGGDLYPGHSLTSQFLGLVADIKGYNYAMTNQQVADHYVSTDDDWWENPDAPYTYTNVNGEIYSSCRPSADLGTISLAEVELEIARMAGIREEQFNVSADTAVPVDGFVIGKQMPAGEALRVLGSAYFRDYPEYDLNIVSTPRGGVTVASLTEENCFEATETDNQTRSQPIDLPRKINLYFYDADAGAVVPVSASRTSINVTAEGIIPLQMPMTLNRDHAKQIAEIMLKVGWEEQTGSRLIRDLPIYEHAYLTPADPIEFEGKRWRIVRTTASEGRLQIEAVRDRASNYLSSATANILEPPQTPVPNIKGPSVFVAMNLPALRTEDVGRSGVYGAVTGLTPAWPGCDIFAALDPDTDTWRRLIRMQSAATMGRLYADLDSAVDSNGLLIDTMYVKLFNGAEIESATQAQVDAGANGFAINTDGVSDIGQFGTADMDSGGIFAVTDVVLGQLGTEAVDHLERDTWVKLDNNLYFIDLPAEWAGEDVYFKAVTIGTPIENAPIFTLTFDPATIIIDGGEVT